MRSLWLSPLYKNVDFLDLQAARVKTNMNEGKMMCAVDPEDYATRSLRHLGYENADYGHWRHHLLFTMLCIPLTAPFVLRDLNKHKDTVGYKESQEPLQTM